MANVIIRDATMSDVENIKTCFDEALFNAEKLWKSIGDGICFVGEINNKMVGLIMARQYSHSWFVDGFYVAEHEQKKNVIDGLLSYIKMLAEVRQVASINIISFKQNAHEMGKEYKVMPVENLSAQFLALWHDDNIKFDPKLRVCMQLKINVEG